MSDNAIIENKAKFETTAQKKIPGTKLTIAGLGI